MCSSNIYSQFNYYNIRLFMNLVSQFYEDSQSESCSSEPSRQIKYINIYKHIPEANPLMEKIQFQSYHLNVVLPIKLKKLPNELRDMTKHEHQTNMSKLEDSVFYHNKLKQKVQSLLIPEKQKIQLQGTLFDNYGHLQPYWKKFNHPGSKYFATCTIDLKTLYKKKKIMPQYTIHHTLDFNGDGKKVEFDSLFQSGNLFQVHQKSYDTFQLILQNDINTRGNNQWFFFKVKNVAKGRTLKFNIINMIKSDSLFNYGMKPTVFSQVRYQKRKVGWIREAQKVSYQPNMIKRQHRDRHFYTLSFQYKFLYDDDIVYFSHSYPYTHSDLSVYLQALFSRKQIGKIVSIKSLGKTMAKNQVDYLTITNQSIHIKHKKIVFILARQHPGETTSNFMLQGIINFLVSDTKSAEFLRNHLEFKIIPMINTDGVIHGNSRCQLVGTDPNRKWKEPTKNLHPIIYQIRRLILKHSLNTAMVLDLHSHSRKLGTFFYGNSQLHQPEASRMFPLFVCKNDDRFNFDNSRFSGGYNTTARSVIFKLLKIPNVYTIQSSFYAYEKGKQVVQYFPEDYKKMGRSLLENYAYLIHQQNPNPANLISIQSQNITVKKHNHWNEVLDALKQNQVILVGDKQSIGSDSDPSEDEFDYDQLMKVLPRKAEIKKKKKKIISKKQQKLEKIQKLQKMQKKDYMPERQTAPFLSNISMRKKISQYIKKSEKLQDTKSNIQKYASIESRGRSIPSKLPSVSTNSSKNTQTEQFTIEHILRLQQNRTVCEESKRQNLCVIGQKMEQKQVWIYEDEKGTQTYLHKEFTAHRSQICKKSLKVPRFINLLQSKENNFLLRDQSLRR